MYLSSDDPAHKNNRYVPHTRIHIGYSALCQMLGYSPYESSLAPIIVMVGAILFAQK